MFQLTFFVPATGKPLLMGWYRAPTWIAYTIPQPRAMLSYALLLWVWTTTATCIKDFSFSFSHDRSEDVEAGEVSVGLRLEDVQALLELLLALIARRGGVELRQRRTQLFHRALQQVLLRSSTAVLIDS